VKGIPLDLNVDSFPASLRKRRRNWKFFYRASLLWTSAWLLNLLLQFHTLHCDNTGYYRYPGN